MSALAFVTDFEPRHGEPVRLTPLVARVTAANSGPFTFHGTNSYIVGDRTVMVVDPGPDDPAHVEALIAAIGKRPVSHILVTHTHRDHSPASRALKAATGAPIVAEGPHRPARPLHIGEINPLDASGDTDFMPDIFATDGMRIAGEDATIEVVTTPGHTDNHACFALAEEDLLFSGDHVMAWSTSIVAPPDGAMVDYMASLDKLIARHDRRLLPGHGAAVDDPQTFLAGLIAHRRGRERAVIARLVAGDETIPVMVETIYADVDRRLYGAAGLSLLAHLEDLVARGIVVTDGAPGIDNRYSLAG
ncbi:glyoxylase-like metal-dependent hydrolase (beta-lactamase superfamily II) [Rhodobium orientis]|uniref:MBL fold metallo-hydrolase n=1 Tax=Rhodobium orientis TaxID=34017 RepID=A0A327JLA2_9HYPH|nr:MBL fold metallo-hydrolase [Rhodobium orientis]MBB4303881.1 glyoxylase-like metal-dependent hydrolase (beta-lactamase superfamily II) [Rhodobium orientis]MBK5951428.1 MBL fold metallo-hydrolase [Rhodobium orientis]RAI26134.1 MBL fold metallo-hydrolase [Rhodobium orientis]